MLSVAIMNQNTVVVNYNALKNHVKKNIQMSHPLFGFYEEIYLA